MRVKYRGKFNMSKAATRTPSCVQSEGLHRSALKGYADGGAVGFAKMTARASSDSYSKREGVSMPAITINSPVTVNASGGSPEQSADLAKHVARETEASMRSVVRDEIERQFRSVAMLNQGR